MVDARAPEGTFDVGEAGWVRARSGRWVDGGVALEVDVESCTKIGGVTFLLTLNCVVRLEGVEAEVGVCIHSGLKVGERCSVALWCSCRTRSSLRVFGKLIYAKTEGYD